MRKAFLCHSSVDKEYVRVVARRLGRARVVFDEMSFLPGQDFREAISRGLDEACLFVFFVSEASIQSVWCRYELDEAHYRTLKDQLENHLTLIIDRSVSFDALPNWLRRAKAVIQTAPSQATRDIQHALLSVLPPQYRRPFIGRQPLAESFAKEVAKEGDSPRIVIVSGLEGIGRRSYLERVVDDNLALHLGPFLFINETHDLSDLYFWATDETADLRTRSRMADEIAVFSRLSLEEQVEEIVRRLDVLCRANCTPCIVDEGGLLDDYGKYKPEYDLLLRRFCGQESDRYLALVHRRSPLIREAPFASSAIAQRIPPLEPHETKLLLSQVLRQNQVTCPQAKMNEVAEYLDGYPPSAYFAAAFAADYGLDLLVADKSTLVDLRAKRFTKFVSDLKLTPAEWFVLQYLCSERLLPFEAISVATNESRDVVASALRNLIDHSLVVVVDEKYAVSPPVRDAIIRVRGHLPRETYERARMNLTQVFWSSEEASPSLEVVDATLHAVARTGSTDLAPYQDMVRPSTLRRLAQECYRRQEWDLSRQYAIRAENMAPGNRDASRIHFKALVQLEDWGEAEGKLREIRDSGDPLALYLEGFMLRKQHRYAEACKVFKAAMDAGDTSFPVHRDYADCLHRCGRYIEAKENLQWVLDRDADNVFTLDMMCRICIEGGFLDDADRILHDLERCDVQGRFVHHRRARLFDKRGAHEAALQEAELACQTGYAPFESFAQRCDLFINLGRIPEAWTALCELERRFGARHRGDVQVGLRTKLLTRQGKWRDAKAAWNRLERKDEPVHMMLLAQILDAEARDPDTPLSDREVARASAAELRRSVGQASQMEFGEEQFLLD